MHLEKFSLNFSNSSFAIRADRVSLVFSRRIESNKIEPKFNRTQSNIYILLWVRLSNQSNKIARSRTQSESIVFGILFFISKSPGSNHNQPLLNGIYGKTSKYQTECQFDRSVIERSILFDIRPLGNRTLGFCSIDQILVWVRLCSITEPNRTIGVRLGSITYAGCFLV